MQILLCAATSFEIEPTKDFIKGRNLSNKISVHITGVGLMAATYSITKSIATHQPKLIIQAGIAGGLDLSLALAQTVVVNSETLGDSGVQEAQQFKTIFDLGLTDRNGFPWKNGELINPDPELLNSFELKKVKAVTVHEITTNKDRIELYKNGFGAQIETMEGAALHYVALVEGISFLQLRSISNYIGERDKKKWKMAEAIAALNAELQKTLIKLLT